MFQKSWIEKFLRKLFERLVTLMSEDDSRWNDWKRQKSGIIAY